MIEDKHCSQCGSVKAAEEFYPRSRVCKACYCARVRGHRRESHRPREYDRERARLPSRKAYAQTVVKEWREKNPDGYKAHNAVNNALRDGKLIKQPCEICGTTEHVAGHHEDYAKPLEVRWLCPLHHQRLHAERVG